MAEKEVYKKCPKCGCQNFFRYHLGRCLYGVGCINCKFVYEEEVLP